MDDYNKNELTSIINYFQNREFYRVLPMIEEYYKKYPKDEVAMAIYLNVLTKLGYFEMASDIISSLNLSRVKLEKTMQTINYCKLKILILEKKYQEALDLIRDDFVFFKEDEVYYVKAFLKNKLGLPVNSSGFDGYVYQQVLSYDIDRMYDYLREMHMGLYPDKSCFSKNIDIDHLISVVRDNLINAPKSYNGLFLTDYYFKLNNCGTYMGQNANYLFVCVLNDSDDIMFLNPSLNEEKYPVYDISDKMIDLSFKSRSRSQIDKFNAKYKNII